MSMAESNTKVKALTKVLLSPIEILFIQNRVRKGENSGHLSKTNSFVSATFYFPANALTLSQTSPGFYVSAVQSYLKHCGKRRNCS